MIDEQLAWHADAVKVAGQRDGLAAGIGTFDAQTDAVAGIQVLTQAVEMTRGV